jgi:hypothetical protein
MTEILGPNLRCRDTLAYSTGERTHCGHTRVLALGKPKMKSAAWCVLKDALF